MTVPAPPTAKSVRMQIAEQILKTLKSMDFKNSPDDNCSRIDPTSIILRKVVNPERDINVGQVMTNFPNILVSCPKQEPFNPAAGENNHDEYIHCFMLQITDSDNHEPLDNADTYWWWQEMINDEFQFAGPSQFPYVNTYRLLCNCTSVLVVDEKYWVKEEGFRAGVMLAVKFWKTRNSGP